MFAELFPLLEKRTVMITLASVGDGRIRANVIPARAKQDETADVALSAPLTMTATPAEMDERFAAELTQFTESALQTASTLDEVKTQHKAAIHALEEENKKKLADKKKVNGGKPVTEPEAPKPGPEFKDGKPVFGTKAGATTSQPPRSLFDNARASETPPPCAPQETPVSTEDAEEEGNEEV